MKCGVNIMPYVMAANSYFFNFSHSLIQTILMHEFVKWSDDDAITHDLLRMRITNLT
jgi:hypothetical protein